MTKEEHKRKLIDYLDDAIGARDYYLDTEDREVIVEALRQPAYDPEAVVSKLWKSTNGCGEIDIQTAVEIVKEAGHGN